MTTDHFTHTETDAGLYEFHHGDTVYGYYRPTRAEAERDECEHEHQSDLEGRTVWPPNYDVTFVCDDCGEVVAS